jgi:hypothetical protein
MGAAELLNILHPMVGRLNILYTHKATIKDYHDSIQSSQMLNAFSKGPTILFLPPQIMKV